jgi:putative DNA primase/helicase
MSRKHDPLIIPRLAGAILYDGQFAQDAAGGLYAYRNGVYVPNGAERVRESVKVKLQQSGELYEWSRHLTEEVVEFIRVGSQQLSERPLAGLVNLANGMLDLKTRDFRPHSPSYLTTIQIPVKYDPEATCPFWEWFIAEVFPADAVEAGVPWEILAYLMSPDLPRQRAILLLGSGGNGKSRYLQGATAFLGAGNVSAVALHAFSENRFAAAQLFGKLANICSDLPSRELESSSIFKAITGGDRICAERKFGQPFDFVPFCALIFSANQLPRCTDAASAFLQRWYPVPFSGVFRGTDRELSSHDIDAALAYPRELSGVLNKALEALSRVRRHGLTVTPSVRATMEEFRKATDPVGAWLDATLVPHWGAAIPKRVLYGLYASRAEAEVLSQLGEGEFSRTLRRWKPDIVDGQRTIAGKREHCWIGVQLRSAEPSGEEDQSYS